MASPSAGEVHGRGPAAATIRQLIVACCRSSSATDSIPNASRDRSSSAGIASWPRSTLPASVASVCASAEACAARLLCRPAVSTTDATVSATSTNAARAKMLFGSAMANWWIGGMK